MTRVHLLGVGGAAMSALANLYLDRGDSVSGSDAEASETTRALAEIGAEVRIGHAAANVGQAELVVTSTAVPDDNPELAEARRRGIPVLHRSRAAAELLRGLRQVAVAGTHGKTTTTTLCAAVLGPLDPTVLSGGRLPGSRFNSRPGAGRWAVVEADESDRSFLALAPQIGVVTNVEADHLDHFRDLGEIMAAFEEFATRVGGTLVGCADDPGAVEVLAAAPGDVLTYGFGPADVRGFDYTPGGGGSVFGVETPWGAVQATLPLPGPHNARNALAAIAVGHLAGLDLEGVVAGLRHVSLPGRRLELVAEVGGARVYDDYGHHPTEVAATLRAARELGPGRLVCAFQPHRYSRLAALMADFARCFTEADEVLLLPVYPASEAPIPGIDSAALALAIGAADPGRPVTVLAGLDDLPGALRARLADGDVAVCMGAGDIYRASRSLGAGEGGLRPSAPLGAAR